MGRPHGRRVGLAALVASLCLVGAGCGAPDLPAGGSSPSPGTEVRRDPDAPVRYLPLGDSITDGFSVPGGYRTVLWQRLVKQEGDDIDFVGSRSSGPATLGDKDNEGHPGWCIDGPCGGGSAETVYPRLHGWLTATRPDIVSVHLGTNDLKFGASGPVVGFRLDETLAQIYRDEPDAYVVVAQIVPMEGVTRSWSDYNRLVPQIAARYQEQGRHIEVVDLSHVVAQPGDFADGLHPNAKGYAKMADALAPALQRAYVALRR